MNKIVKTLYCLDYCKSTKNIYRKKTEILNIKTTEQNTLIDCIRYEKIKLNFEIKAHAKVL